MIYIDNEKLKEIQDFIESAGDENTEYGLFLPLYAIHESIISMVDQYRPDNERDQNETTH